MEVVCPNCEFSREINDHFLAHRMELTCPNCRATFNLPPKYEIELNDSIKYIYKIEIIHEPNMLDPFFKKRIETLVNKIAAEGWKLEKIIPWTMRSLLLKKDVLYLFFKKIRRDDGEKQDTP